MPLDVIIDFQMIDSLPLNESSSQWVKEIESRWEVKAKPKSLIHPSKIYMVFQEKKKKNTKNAEK